jgi:hypothetical protein
MSLRRLKIILDNGRKFNNYLASSWYYFWAVHNYRWTAVLRRFE